MVCRSVGQGREKEFPRASEVLKKRKFADDIYAGADELGETGLNRDELIRLMDTAGITLDKWTANHQDIL